MKKLIILLSVIGIFIFYSCNNSAENPSSSSKNQTPPTPTNTFIPGTTPGNTINPTSTPNPTADNITGILFLPTPQPGKQFFVTADTDLDRSNGFIANMWGLCGVFSSVAYYLTVPDGSYYITAGVDVNNTGFVNGPINGDLYGYYTGGIITVNSSQPNHSNINIYLTAAPTFTATNTSTVTNTPTETATTTGSITGNLSNMIPDVAYNVWLDTNLNPFDGYEKDISGIAGSNTQSFTFNNVNPGSYYVYAWCDSNPNELPYWYVNILDRLGWYGSNYPSAPLNQNVIVQSGMTTSNIDISLQIINSPNFNVKINYPSLLTSKQAACVVDNDTNFFNGFAYLETATVSGTSYTFSVYIPFPGNYHIYAFIDNDNSGINSGPTVNDFKGYSSQYYYNSGANGYIEINLN